MSNIDKSLEIINQLSDDKPEIGIILGSGMSGICNEFKSKILINYNDLPGFPKTLVDGHKGELIIGKLNNVPILCLNGRSHFYEGDNKSMILPIRVLKNFGIKTLIITNAAGGINSEYLPGSLMLIKDHINFQSSNPLVGKNNDTYGPRFPDLSNAYDHLLRREIVDIAKKLKILLHEGVYLACLGPNFETPAEINAFRILGADAVGMSTVPEVILARHCDIRVLAISVITNLAAGITSKPITHQETLANAKIASKNMISLISNFVYKISNS